MNTAASPADSASASASQPGPGPVRAVVRPPRRLWPWALLALALLLVLATAGVALWLFSLLGHGMEGWRISIGGEDFFQHLSNTLHRLGEAVADFWTRVDRLDWHWPWSEEVLSPGGLLLAVLALTVVLVLLLVGLFTLLPLILLAGLVSLSLVVMAGLLLAGGLAALVLAPLWLPVLLALWWLFRRRAVAPRLQAAPAQAPEPAV